MVGSDRIAVTCDWGLRGLRAAATGRAVVIVDVLSFSTAVTVAVSRGATIFPCEWNDQRAAQLAKETGADLASKRGEGRLSLAPASLRQVPRGFRLVLPSPNGSTLAFAARELDAAAVAIGCLRNAAAVARWIGDRDAAVIAAGEKWPDGSLRFAIEDWLGAGTIIRRLAGAKSAEATAAEAAFERMRGSLHAVLAESRSGVELIEKGYPDDIDIAAELDVDEAVPVLTGNALTLARS
jgi:2-phosphosulfolactate phosphatase